MGLKNMLTNLRLVEDDSPATQQAVTAPVIQQAAPVYSTPLPFSAATPTPQAVFDPDMVSKMKVSVLGTSPILNQFMQNLELVRPQFPNDESASMKAALAFTRVDKNALLSELNRTVGAALLHTKNSLENEHKKAREAAVGGLESQLSSINSDISKTQAQITELQQSVTSKQTNAADLQDKIRDAELNLQQQDNVVKGSLSQVEQYLSMLGQTFAKL